MENHIHATNEQQHCHFWQRSEYRSVQFWTHPARASRLILSTCHDSLFNLVFLINIVAERKFALWLTDAIPQFWGLAYWRHLVNPLPFPNVIGKNIFKLSTTFCRSAHLRKIAHISYLVNQAANVAKKIFRHICRQIYKSIRQERINVICAGDNFAQICAKGFPARKYFLSVGYEGVDVSPLVGTIDKEVISNEPPETAGGILQLSNRCGLNLVPESWHELFLHTRLPFYPPQRLPYHATTIIFSTSRHYLALVTKGDERWRNAGDETTCDKWRSYAKVMLLVKMSVTKVTIFPKSYPCKDF